MKRQTLFGVGRENKEKNIINLSSAEFVQRGVGMKYWKRGAA